MSQNFTTTKISPQALVHVSTYGNRCWIPILDPQPYSFSANGKEGNQKKHLWNLFFHFCNGCLQRSIPEQKTQNPAGMEQKWSYQQHLGRSVLPHWGVEQFSGLKKTKQKPPTEKQAQKKHIFFPVEGDRRKTSLEASEKRIRFGSSKASSTWRSSCGWMARLLSPAPSPRAPECRQGPLLRTQKRRYEIHSCI